MKNLFKIFTLILTIVLVSCQAEKETIHSGQRVFTAKNLSFKQFYNETGLSNIETYINSQPNSTSLQGKTSDGKYEISDFFIDTEIIKSLEFLGEKTYSFKVVPNDYQGTNIFNLILYKKDNLWERTIVELKPTPENLFNLQNGLTNKFEGQMREVYQSIVTGGGCTTITITTPNCHGCPLDGECDGCKECFTVTVFVICTSLDDGSGAGGGGIIIEGGNNNSSGYTSPIDSPINQNPNGATFFDPNLTSSSSSLLNDLDATQFNTFLNNLHNSNLEAYNYLNQHLDIKNQIMNYLVANGFNIASKVFANWEANYLQNNPTVTFATFQNQFLSIKEGLDGDFDEAFWDDVNLTFPPQNTPTWSNFQNAYPKHHDVLFDTPNKMYNYVGGVPLAIFNSSGNGNTCALRLSVALNACNITIPNIPGKTFKGEGINGKYYFLSAANLLAWMKKTFGTPTGTNHLLGSQGGINGENFPNLLQGKKGIYIMIANSPSGFGATGHADMLDPNTSCDGGCYFDAQIGGVKEIFIFELP